MTDKILYGRKMKLSIILMPNREYAAEQDYYGYPSSSNIQAPESINIELNGVEDTSLSVEFEVNYPGMTGWYYSEIVVYNFNERDLKRVIDEGAAVKLEAGYVNGNYGMIFEGYIFQCLFERENIVDYKLTLRCVDGRRLFTENFTSFSLPSGMNNQLAHFNAIHAYAKEEIKIAKGKTTSMLKTENHPRGTTVFSTPQKALDDLLRHYSISEPSNTSITTEKGETVTFDMNDPPDPNVIHVSPDGTGGLIGSPVQTQYGCNFCVLLNANIKLTAPRKQVQIDNSLIRAMKAQQNVELLPPFDDDMIYQVIGVKHVGETRGNSWYTYVTGINQGGAQALYLTYAAKMGR